MAAKIVIVVFLSLLLRSSLSLPVSQDVKTVQSTDSVPESGLTKRKPVLNLEKKLRLEKDNKFVQSLSTETLLKAFESFEAVHGKRIKRYITKTSELCPKDMYQYRSWCLKKKPGEEYEGSEGSDDYVAEK